MRLDTGAIETFLARIGVIKLRNVGGMGNKSKESFIPTRNDEMEKRPKETQERTRPTRYQLATPAGKMMAR